MNAGYRRILVAIDDSHAAQRALGEGIGIAQAPGGELRIIHVLEGQSIALTFNPYARYYTRDLVRQLRQAGAELLARAASRVRAAGVVAETVLCDSQGRPVEERILELARAWPADLIVMGTHGRRGVGRALLGRCAEGVIRQSNVPVLLARAA
ncbi:universal stress protein [Achromobacter xylosoxidans]|uniref:universal stress protein n=1 Tax=Alcaligenes xylosoxydans xylosoxydans TaxID=85698 RepID=UPI00292CBB0D|nr:universal stress protein [Achromobacter xylosoxidans]WOB76848.1 universal stress protein [Achromobacter xylosoxidans]